MTKQTITNERIAEMLDEINAAGDDHFDAAYSWDEYDGATTAAQYAETDAAYVLSDGTVIEYDEPEHAFVARRVSEDDTAAESARLRTLWAKLDAESGYAR